MKWIPAYSNRNDVRKRIYFNDYLETKLPIAGGKRTPCYIDIDNKIFWEETDYYLILTMFKRLFDQYEAIQTL